MSQSLSTYIRKSFPGIKTDEHKRVFKTCLLYLCRAISANEFSAQMKPYPAGAVVKIRDFRLHLTSDSYFTLTLRLFALKLMGETQPERDEFESMARKAAVMERDFRRLWQLRWPMMACKLIRRVRKSEYLNEALTPAEVRRRCGTLLTQMNPTIEKTVKRRLRFVWLFNGVDMESLIGDVRARIVQQFNWSYAPVMNEYVQQHFYQVMYNTIHNMATYYSVSGRKASSERDSAGISRRLMVNASEIDARNDMRNGTEDRTTTSVLEQLADPDPTAEVLLARRQRLVLIISMATCRQRMRFLNILSGIEDRRFNNWLYEQRIIPHSKNHMDLQDEIEPDQFLRHLAKHFKVRRSVAAGFLNQIKSKLQEAGYEHAFA